MGCMGCSNGSSSANSNYCYAPDDPYKLDIKFTPPSSCQNRFTPVKDIATYSNYVTVYHDIYDRDCYPPGYQSDSNAMACANDYGASYSAGVCPDGYTTYARATTIATGTAISTGEMTLATCCLDGYSYNSFESYFTSFPYGGRAYDLATKLCISRFDTLEILTLSYNSTTTFNTSSPITILSDSEVSYYTSTTFSAFPVVTTVPVSSGMRAAAPVFLLGRDLDALASPPTASPTTHTPTDLGSDTPGTTGGTGESGEGAAGSDTGKHALSTGAKAGIGVGAAAFAILICLGAIFLVRRARKRRAVPAFETQAYVPEWVKPEGGFVGMSGDQRGMTGSRAGQRGEGDGVM